jgi:hypothetical protein
LEFILDNQFCNYQLIVASVNATSFIDLSKYKDINLIEIVSDISQVMNEDDYKVNKVEIEENLSYFKNNFM